MKKLFILLTAFTLGAATLAKAGIAVLLQTTQHQKKSDTSKLHKPTKAASNFTPAATGSTPSSTDVQVKPVGTVAKENKATKGKGGKMYTKRKADTGKRKH